MSKKKSKWRLTYWHRDRDVLVTEGFATYEDMITRKMRLQQTGQGWNFMEVVR